MSQEVKEVNLADQQNPGGGNSSPEFQGSNPVPVQECSNIVTGPAKFTIMALPCNPRTQEAEARRA